MTAVLRLTEWERRDLEDAPTPTAADLRLAADLARFRSGVLLSWLHDGRLRIDASAGVGTVQLSGLRIEVVPKLVGGTLGVLRMLAYARRSSVLRRLAVRAELDVERHLLDLVVAALLSECEVLLRGGLVVGYRTVDERLPVLRGRLRVLEQVTRYGERIDRLECRHGKLTADVPENQLLLRALDLARVLPREAALRLRAAHLSEHFAAATSPWSENATAFRRRVRLTRATRRYAAAHELALLLLEHQGLRDPWTRGRVRVGAFLLDMNELFEAFVERLVGDAVAPMGVRVSAQARNSSLLVWRDSGRPYGSLRPDLVLTVNEDALPVDAKYKRYDLHKVGSGDVYQAFAYAHAFPRADGLEPDVVIVHPSEGAATVVDLTVAAQHRPTHLRVVGLDLTEILEDLDRGDPSGAALARLRLNLGLTREHSDRVVLPA